MKNILIIGGSKGIGNALLKMLIGSHKIINISRTLPEITHENLTNYSLDVTEDELPTLDTIDGIVYCPGSINLKPFSRLKLGDFEQDFKINVLSAVKVIQFYLKNYNFIDNIALECVYFNLAKISFKQKAMQKSKIYLEKALEIKPDFKQALLLKKEIK